jgi:hypothetical protein
LFYRIVFGDFSDLVDRTSNFVKVWEFGSLGIGLEEPCREIGKLGKV